MGQSQLDQVVSTLNPQLAQFILCMFIFVSSILILNLLIALMNNSYSKIQNKQNAEWNRERAKIMIDQWRSPLVLPRYSYCLVRQDDRRDRINAKKQDVFARLTRIESSLTAFQAQDKQSKDLDTRLSKIETSITELKELLRASLKQ
jgi:hypothetical protein